MSNHDDEPLMPRADWRSRYRGTNENEYEIYRANAEALGWPAKREDRFRA